MCVLLVSGLRSRLAQTLDDGGVGHPAALAHGLQTVAAAALLERVDQRGHDPSAASAERVANPDRTAVDVRLGQVRAGVVGPSERRLGGAEVPAWTL